MSPETAERVRLAALRFADELVAALSADDETPDRLYSVTEAAERLSIGRSMVYWLISAGRLRSLTVGDRRLVSAAAIREYIEAAGK